MNWLHTFWFSYWWASIKGNAPEDVTSLILVGAVTVIVVPRVRRWIAQEAEHLHRKLDHLIIHTEGVPNEVPGLPEHRQPKPPIQDS